MIDAIYIAAGKGERQIEVEVVRAVAGKGLQCDRNSA
jgi:hypothetical protein